jgi:hypothetical protein
MLGTALFQHVFDETIEESVREQHHLEFPHKHLKSHHAERQRQNIRPNSNPRDQKSD